MTGRLGEMHDDALGALDAIEMAMKEVALRKHRATYPHQDELDFVFHHDRLEIWCGKRYTPYFYKDLDDA